MTIAERAKALYDANVPDYGPGGTPEMYGYDNGYQQGIYDGYIEGATEQKAIDDAARDALDARMYGINMKILEKKKSEWLDKACEVAHRMGFDGVADQIRKELED